MTIRDLIDGLTGELQGEVIVQQYNYETGDFDFQTPLWELDFSGENSILDKPIRHMFADAHWIRNRVSAPILFIEVEEAEE